jgi:hypothetical protein
LIYQGFSAPHGCPKNIFRQNPLHPPFSFSFIIDTFPSKEKRKKNDFNEKEAALAVQRSTFRQTRFPTDLAKE